jgi:hypothetical protein
MATITEALAEVYASNPQGEVVLTTLELRHSSFIDEAGNPAPIRVVADYSDLVAKLERDAPLNAGQNVTFTAVAFQFARENRMHASTFSRIEPGCGSARRRTADAVYRECQSNFDEGHGDGGAHGH